MPEWDPSIPYDEWEWYEAQRIAEEEARRRATEEVRKRAEAARRLQEARNAVIRVPQPWTAPPMTPEEAAPWTPPMTQREFAAPVAPQTWGAGTGIGSSVMQMPAYSPQETPEEIQRFQQGVRGVLDFLKEETAPARQKTSDWWKRMRRPWDIDPRKTGEGFRTTGTAAIPQTALNIYRDVFGNLVVPKGSTTSPIGRELAEALGKKDRGAALSIPFTNYEVPLPFITDQGLYSFTSKYSKGRQFLDETPQRALEVGRRFIQPLAREGMSLSRRSMEGELTDQEIAWLENMAPAERKRLGERTGVYLPNEAPPLSDRQRELLANPSQPWMDFLPDEIKVQSRKGLLSEGPAPTLGEQSGIGIRGLAGLLRGPSWQSLTEKDWQGRQVGISEQSPTALQQVYPEINNLRDVYEEAKTVWNANAPAWTFAAYPERREAFWNDVESGMTVDEARAKHGDWVLQLVGEYTLSPDSLPAMQKIIKPISKVGAFPIQAGRKVVGKAAWELGKTPLFNFVFGEAAHSKVAREMRPVNDALTRIAQEPDPVRTLEDLATGTDNMDVLVGGEMAGQMRKVSQMFIDPTSGFIDPASGKRFNSLREAMNGFTGTVTRGEYDDITGAPREVVTDGLKRAAYRSFAEANGLKADDEQTAGKAVVNMWKKMAVAANPNTLVGNAGDDFIRSGILGNWNPFYANIADTNDDLARWGLPMRAEVLGGSFGKSMEGGSDKLIWPFGGKSWKMFSGPAGSVKDKLTQLQGKVNLDAVLNKAGELYGGVEDTFRLSAYKFLLDKYMTAVPEAVYDFVKRDFAQYLDPEPLEDLARRASLAQSPQELYDLLGRAAPGAPTNLPPPPLFGVVPPAAPSPRAPQAPPITQGPQPTLPGMTTQVAQSNLATVLNSQMPRVPRELRDALLDDPDSIHAAMVLNLGELTRYLRDRAVNGEPPRFGPWQGGFDVEDLTGVSPSRADAMVARATERELPEELRVPEGGDFRMYGPPQGIVAGPDSPIPVEAQPLVEEAARRIEAGGDPVKVIQETRERIQNNLDTSEQMAVNEAVKSEQATEQVIGRPKNWAEYEKSKAQAPGRFVYPPLISNKVPEWVKTGVYRSSTGTEMARPFEDVTFGTWNRSHDPQTVLTFLRDELPKDHPMRLKPFEARAIVNKAGNDPEMLKRGITSYVTKVTLQQSYPGHFSGSDLAKMSPEERMTSLRTLRGGAQAEIPETVVPEVPPSDELIQYASSRGVDLGQASWDDLTKIEDDLTSQAEELYNKVRTADAPEARAALSDPRGKPELRPEFREGAISGPLTPQGWMEVSPHLLSKADREAKRAAFWEGMTPSQAKKTWNSQLDSLDKQIKEVQEHAARRLEQVDAAGSDAEKAAFYGMEASVEAPRAETVETTDRFAGVLNAPGPEPYTGEVYEVLANPGATFAGTADDIVEWKLRWDAANGADYKTAAHLHQEIAREMRAAGVPINKWNGSSAWPIYGDMISEDTQRVADAKANQIADAFYGSEPLGKEAPVESVVETPSMAEIMRPTMGEGRLIPAEAPNAKVEELGLEMQGSAIPGRLEQEMLDLRGEYGDLSSQVKVAERAGMRGPGLDQMKQRIQEIDTIFRQRQWDLKAEESMSGTLFGAERPDEATQIATWKQEYKVAADTYKSAPNDVMKNRANTRMAEIASEAQNSGYNVRTTRTGIRIEKVIDKRYGLTASDLNHFSVTPPTLQGAHTQTQDLLRVWRDKANQTLDALDQWQAKLTGKTLMAPDYLRGDPVDIGAARDRSVRSMAELMFGLNERAGTETNSAFLDYQVGIMKWQDLVRTAFPFTTYNLLAPGYWIDTLLGDPEMGRYYARYRDETDQPESPLTSRFSGTIPVAAGGGYYGFDPSWPLGFSRYLQPPSPYDEEPKTDLATLAGIPGELGMSSYPPIRTFLDYMSRDSNKTISSVATMLGGGGTQWDWIPQTKYARLAASTMPEGLGKKIVGALPWLEDKVQLLGRRGERDAYKDYWTKELMAEQVATGTITDMERMVATEQMENSPVWREAARIAEQRRLKGAVVPLSVRPKYMSPAEVDLREKQDGYYAIPEMDTAARAEYLRENPELAAYWERGKEQDPAWKWDVLSREIKNAMIYKKDVEAGLASEEAYDAQDRLVHPDLIDKFWNNEATVPEMWEILKAYNPEKAKEFEESGFALEPSDYYLRLPAWKSDATDEEKNAQVVADWPKISEFLNVLPVTSEARAFFEKTLDTKFKEMQPTKRTLGRAGGYGTYLDDIGVSPEAATNLSMFRTSDSASTATHELAHWWAEHHKDSRDGFGEAFERLANETDPAYAEASDLAKKGIELYTGEDPDFLQKARFAIFPGHKETELYAELIQQVDANITRLPGYIRKYYEPWLLPAQEQVSLDRTVRTPLAEIAQEVAPEVVVSAPELQPGQGESDFWDTYFALKDQIGSSALGKTVQKDTLLKLLVDKTNRDEATHEQWQEGLVRLYKLQGKEFVPTGKAPTAGAKETEVQTTATAPMPVIQTSAPQKTSAPAQARTKVAETDIAWLEAFKREHGWYPWEDPNLAQKGFSPEQAYAEHTKAKSLSQGQSFPGWEESWQKRYGYTDRERPYLAGRDVPSMQAPAPRPVAPVAPVATQPSAAAAFRQADQTGRYTPSPRNMMGATGVPDRTPLPVAGSGRGPQAVPPQAGTWGGTAPNIPGMNAPYQPSLDLAEQARRAQYAAQERVQPTGMMGGMPMIQQQYQPPQQPTPTPGIGSNIVSSMMANNPRIQAMQQQYGGAAPGMPLIMQQGSAAQYGAHLTMLAQQDPQIVAEIADAIDNKTPLSEAAKGALIQHAQRMGMDMKQLLLQILQQEQGGN